MSNYFNLFEKFITLIFGIGFIILFIVEITYQIRFGILGEIPDYITSFKYRYFDSNQVPKYRYNSIGWHTGISGKKTLIKINCRGYRGSLPNLKDVYRIVVIGDSIPFGGAVDDKETFSAILEKLLNEINKYGKKFQVINLGVEDIGMEDYILKLKYEALDYKPNLVILATFTNDWSVSQHALLQKFSNLEEKNPVNHYPDFFMYRKLITFLRKSWIAGRPEVKARFKWSEMYNNLQYKRSESLWLKMVKLAKYDWGSAWFKENYIKFEENLKLFSDILHKNSISKIWVHFPVRPQLELARNWKNLKLPDINSAILAKKYGFKFLSFTEIFTKNKLDPENLMYDHCHYNPTGHKKIAEELAKFLCNNFHSNKFVCKKFDSKMQY
jgi:hypothetical protein